LRLDIFVRYEEKPSRGKFVKPGIDPLRGSWTDADFEERDYIAQSYVPVASLADAQGIIFLCPACFTKNGGAKRTHGCSVTFAGRGALDHQGSHNDQGQPVRWNIAGGTGLHDLQLSPSIQLIGGCAWHGFVGNSGVPAGSAA
jgi:hypothetical protein